MGTYGYVVTAALFMAAGWFAAGAATATAKAPRFRNSPWPISPRRSARSARRS